MVELLFKKRNVLTVLISPTISYYGERWANLVMLQHSLPSLVAIFLWFFSMNVAGQLQNTADPVCFQFSLRLVFEHVIYTYKPVNTTIVSQTKSLCYYYYAGIRYPCLSSKTIGIHFESVIHIVFP